MMKAHTGFAHRTLRRVLHYRGNIAYRQRQEREQPAQSQARQGGETALNLCEGFLTGYKAFAAQTLNSDSDDFRPYADAVDSAPLLRRCVSLMRQVLSAEADRLCDEFQELIANEADVETCLHETAVSQLANTLSVSQAHAA